MLLSSARRRVTWLKAMFLGLALGLVGSSVAYADSEVQGNLINAPGKAFRSTNLATGSDNRAAQSAIIIKNSTVSGTAVNQAQSRETVNLAVGEKNQAAQSAVVVRSSSLAGTASNSATSRKGINAALGTRNQANQAAIVVTNSTLEGRLQNSANITSSVNMAAGTANQADQGSLRLEQSRGSGTAANSANFKKNANLAVGRNSIASQGAVVIKQAELGGLVVNQANGEEAVNLASGNSSQASQSAIVVDAQGPSGSVEANAHQAIVPESPFPVSTGTRALPASLTRSPRAQEQPAAVFEPGKVVFLVEHNQAGRDTLRRVADKYQLKVGEQTPLESLKRVMVVAETSKQVERIAELLGKESGIYHPQPNYVFATLGQQDPLSPMQSLVSLMDLPKVHSRLRGKDITVAVVDTGVEIEHQDLRSRIAGFQNFIPNSQYRGEIHGTAVAGLITAEANEFGIVGIAPEVSLLALRACRQVHEQRAVGECFSSSLVKSLDAAIGGGADVVNMSLGAQVNDTLLGLLIDSGVERGVIFSAPVGNDPGAEKMAFPASHRRVVSVAGLDEKGNPLPNRLLALQADAVAPATHLLVTAPANGYNFIDGTSLASASIAGIIALAMENQAAGAASCLPRLQDNQSWGAQVLSCLGL